MITKKREFFVHIMNLSVIAESSEEAVKQIIGEMNKEGGKMLYYTVTYQKILDEDLPIPSEEFDSTQWEEGRRNGTTQRTD